MVSSPQKKDPTASDFGHFHAIFETSKVGKALQGPQDVWGLTVANSIGLLAVHGFDRNSMKK